ncbi:MAG: prepilin-type N-terminal cleavage/methylation domain-containing protein [Candidatus Saccharibacteria bacterium]
MIKSINKIKSKGFTIVELLVVIVVIGILAAITIVSYTGITTKAKASKALANANSVIDAATAYNAEKGSFPAISGNTLAVGTYSSLPANGNLIVSATAPTDSTGETTIGYVVCVVATVNTGAKITYWDYAKAGGAGAVELKAGSGC